MTNSFISSLSRIYENSTVPVVIADGELNILWKNPSAGSFFENGENPLSGLFYRDKPDSGIVSRVIDGSVCTFNVLKTFDGEEDDPDKKFFFIAEVIRAEKLDELLNADSVKGFVTYICGKIRNAVSQVVCASDNIYNDVAIGIFDGRSITDELNRIGDGIMSLGREVVLPEEFYSFSDPKKPEVTLAAAREMTKIVESVRKTLGKDVRISEDYDKDLCFTMNPDTFEAVVAFMTAECCGGEFYPEMLVFSAIRKPNNRAEISVMAITKNRIPNDKASFSPRSADLAGIDRKLFFNCICRLLKLKIGAEFSSDFQPHSRVFSVMIDLIPEDKPHISVTYNPEDQPDERFGIIPMSLADFRARDKYSYIELDIIDNSEYNNNNESDNDSGKDEENEKNKL